MKTTFRYILEPFKGMNTRYLCPAANCGKNKTLSLYIDTETGKHIHLTVGRCNRESKCGYHYTPKQYFKDNNILFQNPQPKFYKPTQSKIEYYISENISKINFTNELFLTEIKTYDSKKTGVIQHLTLETLREKLNRFIKANESKDQNPAILKGIYKNGTAGEYCEKNTPFLFYDIDVKENENSNLFDSEKNNTVFEYLKHVSILVWRSNSQKGIAGILYVPQLIEVSKVETEKHLFVSKFTYLHLSNLIEKHTGEKVKFDEQQGKFRQIRYLAEQMDKREINLTPFQFQFEQKKNNQTTKAASFIPLEVFKASLNIKALEKNHFVNFLIDLFGVEVASTVVSRYFIGTSKYWNGATIFWQIDTLGRVRTGKIMLYNPTTGKRIKEPHNHIHWVHRLIKQPEFELRQCFFGEHLLKDKTKTIAIVESEKTAVIASVYLPEFIWLAVGSLNNLNVSKCSILKGRTVILYPDLNGYEKWKNKAKELSHIEKFIVSDLLELNASETERNLGLDLADYLIRFNYKEFNIEPSKPTLNNEKEFKRIESKNTQCACPSSDIAYINKEGTLFIETPYWPTYTIYPSIDHYNERLCLPDFQDRISIPIQDFEKVQINLNTLKIENKII